MKFREFIEPNAIIESLQATDRDGVIRELVSALGAAGAIDPAVTETIASALIAREKAGTTGFGKGVAAPHCKHPLIKKITGTVGLSQTGIAFNALDQKPVHAFFLLLSPQGQDQTHLQAMEVVFRNLKEEVFRKFLRQADAREKVLDLLNEADDK